MDNNMMHIDELFSQKLGGREEKERAGAWLKMRELLDEKMPVNPSAINWRRILGYTSALLLLASATAGSFHYFRNTGSSLSMGSTAPSPSARVASNTLSSAPSSALTNRANQKNINTIANNSSVKTSTNFIASNTSVSKYKTNKLQASTSSSTLSQSNISTMGNKVEKGEAVSRNFNSTSAAKSIPTGKNSTASKDLTLDAPIAKDAVINTAAITASTESSTTANVNNSLQLTASENKTTPPVLAKLTTSDKNNLLPTRTHNKKHSAAAIGANTAAPILASNTNTGIIAKLPAQQLQQEPKPNACQNTFMNLLVLHEKYMIDPITRKGYYHIDTISKDKIEMMSNENALASTNTISSKSLDAAKNSVASTQAVNEHVLASAKQGSSNFLQSFNAMIDNFKYNFKHLEITPGVTAGINATFFAPNGLKGFQLGISNNITLNDKWNLVAELMYFNRLNNNTIFDDYDNFVNPPIVTNTLKYHMLHSFDFSNMHSFELPLYLKYHYHNFIVMGGAQFAYNLAINAEEVLLSLPAISQSEPGISTQPKISVNDFGSRYTMGYILGIGYQINPNLNLNFRYTQNIWDNASSSGSMLISNQFYRQPSLQLNIAYEFARELKMIRR